MSRRSLAAIGAVALVGAAAWAFLTVQRPDWTTDSPAALAAWQAGEEAAAKLYLSDAAAHYAEALQHDPDFVMPKLFFLRHPSLAPGGPQQVQRMLEELRSVDGERLSRRERLLVRYYLAHRDRDREGAREMLETYLEDHPEDPWAVSLRCDSFWESGAWDEASACYRHLIVLDPNRVEGQNRIGYASMAEGRFTEAEAQFEIYRYLAPDQANPHDSLADLLTITGRYDEAEEELERALAIRPDFCPAWAGLVEIGMLRRDPDEATARLERARRAEGCPPRQLAMLACEVEYLRHAADGRWEEVWRIHEGKECRQGVRLLPLVAALVTDRGGEVDRVVADWRRELDGAPEPPALTHVLALRALLRDGDPEAAALLAERADGYLRYLDGDWQIKLWNRLLWADLLERTGRPGEAQELRAQVAEVNPAYAAAPPISLPQ